MILDHFVVGANSTMSFAERGLLAVVGEDLLAGYIGGRSILDSFHSPTGFYGAIGRF